MSERLEGTNAFLMTPEEARVAARDWLAIQAERERADTACRCAAIAQRYMVGVKEERDQLISEAVRAGEVAQVARLCGLSRQHVYAIAAETPPRGRA